MANKREIKKDISHIIGAVVEEAYNVQLIDSKKTEASEAIIEEAVELYDALLERVHGYKTSEKGKRKMYFNNIKHDLFVKASDLFVKVEKL